MLCIYVLTEASIKISWSLPAYMTAQDGFAANMETNTSTSSRTEASGACHRTLLSSLIRPMSLPTARWTYRIHTCKGYTLCWEGEGSTGDSLRFTCKVTTGAHVNTMAGAKTHWVRGGTKHTQPDQNWTYTVAQRELLPWPEKVNVLQPLKQDKSPTERKRATELNSLSFQFIQQDLLGANHRRQGQRQREDTVFTLFLLFLACLVFVFYDGPGDLKKNTEWLLFKKQGGITMQLQCKVLYAKEQKPCLSGTPLADTSSSRDFNVQRKRTKMISAHSTEVWCPVWITNLMGFKVT